VPDPSSSTRAPAPAPNHPTSRLLRSSLLPGVALAAIFAALFASAFHEIHKRKFAAFTCYYRAAVALRAGQSPYDAGTREAYPYVYPPFYAFALGPLTRLPIEPAARVMVAINGSLLLAAVLLAAAAIAPRLTGRRTLAGTLWIALITTGICVVQIHKELGGLQAGILLPFAFVLALFWIDRRPVLAGLALAVAISVKYVPVIALPYLLLRRRWTAVAACAAGTIAFALLPSVSLGWTTNLRYLAMAHGGLARILGMPAASGAAQVHGLDDILNVTVPGASARLAKAMQWPSVAAGVLTLVIATCWLASLVRQYRRRELPLLAWPSRAARQTAPPFVALFALEWAGLVVVAMAFSPNTQLVQAIVPATVAAALAFDLPAEATLRRRLALVITLLCVALYLPMAVTGAAFTRHWNLLATPAWLLLAAYLILTPLVLARAAKDRS
jgi:hypothetical protein